MLDIGCGSKPYAAIFEPHVDVHLGADRRSPADHGESPHGTDEVDIVSSAYEIPVADASFETVLCTAVLEHLEEPQKRFARRAACSAPTGSPITPRHGVQSPWHCFEHLEEPQEAIREARRVLGANGVAIYVAPLIWHVHEAPRDFFRYTEFGLRHLFETAGFEIVEIRPLSGYWVTAGQLFVYYLHRFNRGPLRRVPLIPLIGLLLQGAALALDRLDPAPEWTWAYSVVARAC